MYLALYRKYRPRTFDDVISQEHITTTLRNQIISGQIAHAYLFTGTRGTGKTSCAKIMAKAVNCLSPVNGSPCGHCDSCRAISEGSTDIIEIDAASNNGVDSIRQIRDEVIYTPIDCKYKVYIIDEVHMLTGAAFNALLKTLEEPPEHVIFILATTEYYKVPATILSRCQQFLFSKIDPGKSALRLSDIAEKEGIKLTADAAALISRLSDGAMRDALSLLDQCISSGGEINEEAVRRCSGSADSGYLFAVSEAAIKKAPSQAIEVLDKLINNGKDLSRFIEELTLHYRNLMLAKSVGTALIKASDGDIKKYSQQCDGYSLEEIMHHIDLISDSLDNINRMKQTGQARLLTEQLLIRLTVPGLSDYPAALAARLGALEIKMDNMSKGIIKERVVHSAASAGEKYASDEEDMLPGLRPGTNPGESQEERQTAPSSDIIISAEDHGTAPDKSGSSGTDTVYEEPGEIPLPLPPVTGIDDSENFTAAADINPVGEYTAETGSLSAPPLNIADNNTDGSAYDAAVCETDFELPDNVPILPQWNDIISALPSSSGRLLKKSTAYLYGGKIYVSASTSAKTVLENKIKAAALREKAAEIMGESLDIFLLRERSVSEEKKEDKITSFLDRAREMGIEVTLKDR